MMTLQELHDEFWLLTKSVLQDSRIDTEEAKVLKRWLEEHDQGGIFGIALEKLDHFLKDGYVDRHESNAMIATLGKVLAQLRAAPKPSGVA